MLFFYDVISEFNNGYTGLFGEKDEEGEEEDEQGTTSASTTSNRRIEQSYSFGKKWGWVYWVDRVSETVRDSWNNVYKMNPYEFFNILCYRKDKDEEEKRKLEEWKRTH